MLTLVLVVLLAIILYTLRDYLSKIATSSTPYTIIVVTYLVITDLIVYISLIVPPSTYGLGLRI